MVGVGKTLLFQEPYKENTEMKRFSDLGVTVDAGSNIFQVQQVSITDILNSEIEVLDFESGVRTQHGELWKRYRIRNFRFSLPYGRRNWV